MLVDSLVKYHLIIAVKSRIQILIDFQNVNLLGNDIRHDLHLIVLLWVTCDGELVFFIDPTAVCTKAEEYTHTT